PYKDQLGTQLELRRTPLPVPLVCCPPAKEAPPHDANVRTLMSLNPAAAHCRMDPTAGKKIGVPVTITEASNDHP
ncbi:MAG: hypothetical protein WBD79_13045, partial [Anaerolineae bacterium]